MPSLHHDISFVQFGEAFLASEKQKGPSNYNSTSCDSEDFSSCAADRNDVLWSRPSIPVVQLWCRFVVQHKSERWLNLILPSRCSGSGTAGHYSWVLVGQPCPKGLCHLGTCRLIGDTKHVLNIYAFFFFPPNRLLYRLEKTTECIQDFTRI